MIDESSSASCENLGVVEMNVRAAVRDAKDTYKYRPVKKGPKEKSEVNDIRSWGGMNLLMFTDWWQLPPVM